MSPRVLSILSSVQTSLLAGEMRLLRSSRAAPSHRSGWPYKSPLGKWDFNALLRGWEQRGCSPCPPAVPQSPPAGRFVPAAWWQRGTVPALLPGSCPAGLPAARSVAACKARAADFQMLADAFSSTARTDGCRQLTERIRVLPPLSCEAVTDLRLFLG